MNNLDPHAPTEKPQPLPGLARTHLQHVATAAAIDLQRLAALAVA